MGLVHHVFSSKRSSPLAPTRALFLYAPLGHNRSTLWIPQPCFAFSRDQSITRVTQDHYYSITTNRIAHATQDNSRQHVGVNSHLQMFPPQVREPGRGGNLLHTAPDRPNLPLWHSSLLSWGRLFVCLLLVISLEIFLRWILALHFPKAVTRRCGRLLLKWSIIFLPQTASV